MEQFRNLGLLESWERIGMGVPSGTIYQIARVTEAHKWGYDGEMCKNLPYSLVPVCKEIRGSQIIDSARGTKPILGRPFSTCATHLKFAKVGVPKGPDALNVYGIRILLHSIGEAVVRVGTWCFRR
jgi:hypothetical protein